MTQTEAQAQSQSQAKPRARRRLVFLWAALLLLAAAVALMLYGEEPAPVRPEVAVNFPRRLNQDERKRMESRRVLPELPVVEDAGGPPPPQRPRDPVLATLSGDSAVVVEANAIRNSPVGKLLVDCLLDASKENPIEELKREAGVDLLQDLDRVAMTDQGMVVSGHFGQAKWDNLLQGRATGTRYGDSATFYRMLPREVTGPDGTKTTRQSDDTMVVWGDQMVLLADNEAAARAMVDRVEGRSPVQPVIEEHQTYGEIYGVFSAETLAKMFPADQDAMAERFRSAATRVEVHVDTSRDVGIVTDVQGTDPDQVTDLGKSLGAALALARLQAQGEEEKELAELLDLAKVRPDGSSFKLEMAIPLELLEKYLSQCGERRREREQRWRQRMDAGVAAPAPAP